MNVSERGLIRPNGQLSFDQAVEKLDLVGEKIAAFGATRPRRALPHVGADLTSIGHKEGDSEVRRAPAAATAPASFKDVGTM